MQSNIITFSGDMAENWRTFPKDFIIGVGSASYQIEGGTKDDGKIDFFNTLIFKGRV